MRKAIHQFGMCSFCPDAGGTPIVHEFSGGSDSHRVLFVAIGLPHIPNEVREPYGHEENAVRIATPGEFVNDRGPSCVGTETAHSELVDGLAHRIQCLKLCKA